MALILTVDCHQLNVIGRPQDRAIYSQSRAKCKGPDFISIWFEYRFDVQVVPCQSCQRHPKTDACPKFACDLVHDSSCQADQSILPLENAYMFPHSEDRCPQSERFGTKLEMGSQCLTHRRLDKRIPWPADAGNAICRYTLDVLYIFMYTIYIRITMHMHLLSYVYSVYIYLNHFKSVNVLAKTESDSTHTHTTRESVGRWPWQDTHIFIHTICTSRFPSRWCHSHVLAHWNSLQYPFGCLLQVVFQQDTLLIPRVQHPRRYAGCLLVGLPTVFRGGPSLFDSMNSWWLNGAMRQCGALSGKDVVTKILW